MDPADWMADDEPERPPLDSWGRGSVPSRILEQPLQEEEEVTEVEKMKPSANHQELVDLNICHTYFEFLHYFLLCFRLIPSNKFLKRNVYCNSMDSNRKR